MKGKQEDKWNGQIYKKQEYSRLQQFFGKKIIDNFVSQSKVLGSRVLDIGCGDGFLTSYASRKLNVNCHGVDNSLSMIDAAKLHEDDQLIFSSMDITASNLHLYGQYPLVMSMLCLHWVVAQDKALSNIAQALKDEGQGFLFISAKSSKPSKNPGYIEIIHQLIKEDRYASYFSGFEITRANLTKENYPSMIEAAGLQLNELVEINEPFIFYDKKELSRFFQGIVSGFLIPHQSINAEEIFMKTSCLCDELVEHLLSQGSYQLNDNGTVHTPQSFLLAIVQKPSRFTEDLAKEIFPKVKITNAQGEDLLNPLPKTLLRILNSGGPSLNTRSRRLEREEEQCFLQLK